jgi:hypothetical protein
MSACFALCEDAYGIRASALVLTDGPCPLYAVHYPLAALPGALSPVPYRKSSRCGLKQSISTAGVWVTI